MPYKSLTELPDNVKNHIPKHAQEIYQEAFNNAYKQYKDASKRVDDSTREQTAHKVAWSAVEKKYTKNAAGKWVTKK